MISTFQAGGFGMVPTLAFGLLLLAIGVFHALNPERKLVSLFAILGIVDFASGVLGTAMGAAATLLHVAKLPESQQFPTALLGIAESLHNLALALMLVVLGTLALAVGSLRAALNAGPGRG